MRTILILLPALLASVADLVTTKLALRIPGTYEGNRLACINGKFSLWLASVEKALMLALIAALTLCVWQVGLAGSLGAAGVTLYAVIGNLRIIRRA